MMQRTIGRLFLVLAVGAITIGCGGKSGGGDKKKDVITQKGSDTMILLAQKWAEEYQKKDSTVQVQVNGGGSGTGISALINGQTDIADASRSMSDAERAQMKQKFGTDVVEIPVARDGITLYINSANTVDSLTIDQLRQIYLGQVTNWKDVGGPDQKITLYGRENSSGTYEFFKEHVLNKADFAASTQTLSGTAAVVNGVTKDPGGVGYGGEAFTKGVKVVKLVTPKGALAPSEDNVRSGDYPLSRNLFFYLRKEPTGALKNYVDWVLSADGQAVVKQAGYYPLH